MIKKQLIKDLEKNIYTRIRPSSLHGVGVFAIKNIKKGQNPFAGAGDPPIIRIPMKEIFDNKKISDQVKEMVKSFYAFDDGDIFFPNHSLNQIDVSYFMNHSDKPNISYRAKDYMFIAKRNIKIGEELTTDYHTFSDL